MPLFDLTTERRVLIDAIDETHAKEIAARFLGVSEYREGCDKKGLFRLKTFPGAVASCEFAIINTEKI